MDNYKGKFIYNLAIATGIYMNIFLFFEIHFAKKN